MSQFLITPWTRIATVAAIAIGLTACGQGQQTTPAAADKPAANAPAPIATVDGKAISSPEFDIYLKSLLRGRPAADLTTEQKSQVLDEMINMQLLAAQGAKEGVEKDPDVAA